MTALLYHLSSSENGVSVFAQGGIYNQSENSAGNDFPDADCQHHKRDRKQYLIPIAQDKRYDDRIGQNRRQRSEELALLTQQPREYGADQSRQTSENNIRQDTPAEYVADDTSDEQPRNCGRSEYREDCQRFGKTDLHFSVTEWCEYDRDHYIDRGNHRRL